MVVGKTVNWRQVNENEHNLLNYHFFSEIFLNAEGLVDHAELFTPAGSVNVLPFRDKGKVLDAHGGRYADEGALNRAFPDGMYTFSYTVGNGERINQNVTLLNRQRHSRLPSPISIYLFQNNSRIKPDNVNADLDLIVRWSDFKSGNADPNGIVDDLMFVVTGDCLGNKIDHSGGPFGNSSYLTYASEEYIISGDKLEPGSSYQLFVEQAELDTSKSNGIPEIATWATTSFLDIKTSGENHSGTDCPTQMRAMDGGQTDRLPKR